MVRRAHQPMQLLQGEGNQWGIESGSAFHGEEFWWRVVWVHGLN
jgi:hypothetical protein